MSKKVKQKRKHNKKESKRCWVMISAIILIIGGIASLTDIGKNVKDIFFSKKNETKTENSNDFSTDVTILGDSNCNIGNNTDTIEHIDMSSLNNNDNDMSTKVYIKGSKNKNVGNNNK